MNVLQVGDVQSPGNRTPGQAERSPRGRPAYVFLLAFAGALIVPAVIFAAVLAWFYIGAERDRVLERARFSVHEIVLAVDRELASSRFELAALAASPALRQDDIRTFYDAAQQAAQTFDATIVLRKPGELKPLFSTGAVWGAPLAGDDLDTSALAAEAAEKKQMAISGLLAGSVDRRPVVMLMVPVVRDKAVPYVLSLEIPAGRLGGILSQMTIEDGWSSTLVDAAGRVLARSPEHEAFVGKTLSPEWALQATGAEGMWRGRDLAGAEVASSYVRSPKSDWAVAVNVPDSILGAPVRQALWAFLAAGASIFVVALALAYWSASYLSRAIGSLKSAGLKLANNQKIPEISTPVREVNDVFSVLVATAADAQRREAHLRSILATVPSAMIVIDSRGTIQSFSKTAEKMFGYSADEIIGSNVKVLMPEPDRSAHDGYIDHYLRTGEKRIMGTARTVTGLRRNGARFPLELHVGAADVEGERLFTGFMQDQTEKQRIEQELLQTQKMEAVGKLTGGVAHDFNNLLTVIKGNLEMLEPLIDDENHDLLRDSQEAADLASQLTSSLLAFGRRMPLNPKLADVGQLVTAAGDILRRTLGETIEIHTAIRNACRTVVDGPQLQNAILNLAINARDAMPGGGKLSIAVSEVELDEDYAAAYSEVRPGRYVMVLISDTGTGMTNEVRERAFEPFFTTKPQGAGTGLGLSSVYGFVKQSGGHISLYSEVDRGTTIRIYFPRAADLDRGEHAPAPASAAIPRGAGQLVLVAEDDDRVRRVTVGRLNSLGYQVIEAENGPVALAIIRDKPEIELLFTDMVMPGGMTGAQLAEEARAVRPGLKILFTSGYAEPDLVRQADSKSGNWLRKPYAASELAHTLQSIFKRRAEPSA